jgi:hypothetical protein
MADAGLWQNILSDLSINGHFRLILQPAVAIILGVRLGLTEERPSKPSVRDAIVPVGVAVLTDAILQAVILARVRPTAALLVGVLLVWLPFAIARAVTAHLWNRPSTGQGAPQPA